MMLLTPRYADAAHSRAWAPLFVIGKSQDEITAFD